MIKFHRPSVNRRFTAKGGGLFNNLISSLPFPIHLLHSNYCGPGTPLKEHLANNIQPTNPLDQACKEHDIFYSKFKDTKTRNQADLRLAEQAWQRVKARDSSFGEKVNSWIVTNAMKAKAKLGMGMKPAKVKGKRCRKKDKKQNTLRSVIKKTKAVIQSKKPGNLQDAIRLALEEARKNVIGKRVKLPLTRVIRIPRTGGVLPFLLPLFASLSALGGLATGTSSIVKAINDAKNARKQLSESERHNKTMESIAIGKGLYLKPYKKGLGLFLSPKKGSSLKSKNF